MKKQAFNPYLPSWEYIPDGEPYVFGDRVYIYGSHDFFNGYVFCMGDYMCYSAPVGDLGNWRCEGTIYKRNADPLNKDGKMCLYAPDVTIGPDGRYYLFYCLDKISVVSVAVCDSPCGEFEFYGHVHYADGTILGAREGDEHQFDPGVLTEGDITYLYTGFCPKGDKSRSGAKVTILDKDMLTVIKDPETIVPGYEYSKGTQFENHAFFEASSIRKFNDTYYFIYSSEVMHELCYATSKSPTKDFVYGGVIVSNCDMHIDTYKDANMPTAYGANNHGSVEKILDDYYIFYHRQTNNTWFSRQACAEKIKLESDGSIKQVEITSCGLNTGPLKAEGEYPSYIACNLFIADKPSMYIGGDFPYIMQDGKDGDEYEGYVAHILNNTTIGFKYFDCKNIKKFSITTRAYADGYFELRTSIDGKVLGKIPVVNTNVWETYTIDVDIKDGVYPIYLTYKGTNTPSLKSITFN